MTEMTCERVVTVEQQADYEKRRLALLVPDPWTDPFCAKNGLANMYIESTIAEIMHLRVETDPGVKLNCPNPVYTKYHKLLNDCLQSQKTTGASGASGASEFRTLVKFLEDEVLHRPIEIVKWVAGSEAETVYVPDIRLVDTIGEALGWLARHLALSL